MSSELISTLLQLGAVFLLVLINGFFVAAEFALVSVRKSRIDQLVLQGSARARLVQRALPRLDIYIAATQLGITMASLGLGFVAEPSIARILDPLFQLVPFLHGEGAVISAHAVALGISFAIATALHIVFGELAPKSIALQRADATALWVTAPLDLFLRIFHPAIALLNGVGNAVVRLLGLQPAGEHGSIHSVAELRLLIAASRQQGQLEASEEAIVQRVFGFAEVTADQVMVPRTEMVCLPISATPQEALELATRTRHARLPVYRETIDNIVGVLHTKDLFQWLVKRGGGTVTPSFSVSHLMRTVLTVPESIGADDLLAEMRRHKTHLGIVIDEFGGTAGLVTLEDLVARLVGDVGDEFEPATPSIELLPDGTALVDGLAPIDEINRRFGLAIVDEFNNTIAGHVFSQLGRKPELGDTVTVADRTFVVEALDGLRIARLRLLPARTPAVPAATTPGAMVLALAVPLTDWWPRMTGTG